MMENIVFFDKEHRDFYEANGVGQDSYRQGLMYLLGLTEDTSNHLNEIYVPGEGIKREVIQADWVTGETGRLLVLAFNLWNDYRHGLNDSQFDERSLDSLSSGELIEIINNESWNTVTNIFGGSLGFYYLQAINIRFNIDRGEAARRFAEGLINKSSGE